MLLWELLSSIKKLTHLAIDLCMLIQSSNCDSADKEKLSGMLGKCGSLKALRVANGFIMNLQITLVHVLSLTMNIFDKSI